MIELSAKPFENLLFWNLLKTAYVLVYLNIFGTLLLGIISGTIGLYVELLGVIWLLLGAISIISAKFGTTEGSPQNTYKNFIFWIRQFNYVLDPDRMSLFKQID